MTKQDRAAMQSAVDGVVDSRIGGPLLDELAADGTRIRIVSDADFYETRPYSVAASFTYATNTITFPRSRVHSNVAYTGASLVHEARHQHDMPYWVELGRRTRTGAGGALQAMMEGRSPVQGARDAVRRLRDGHEVRAYRTQGELAIELGNPRLGGGGVRDGTVASERQVRDRLDRSVSYRRDRRRADIESRPDGARPPSDPDGRFDGPASTFSIDEQGRIRPWRGPGLVESIAPAGVGAIAGATVAVALTRARSPRAAIIGAVLGATSTFAWDVLRRR